MANSIARFTALVFLAAVPLLAQTRRVLPVDESGRDLSLVAYLARVKDAVANKDFDALLPLVDSNIKLGFGGTDGIANFLPDWSLLQRLLGMGGAWQADSFSIPYVFAKFPDDLDGFDYAVITGKGVWLRAGPGTGFRGLRQLSYDILKVENNGESWQEVETLDGIHGYVSARYIWSPTLYRAIFQKNPRGEWKMFALLSGD